jgi:hypothetical protein
VLPVSSFGVTFSNSTTPQCYHIVLTLKPFVFDSVNN